jgi:hypothetical protein
VTRLMEEALARIQSLPSAEQDAVASIILDEIADEQRWDATFAASQDQLSRMAAKARTDVKSGRVREVGMDEL